MQMSMTDTAPMQAMKWQHEMAALFEPVPGRVPGPVSQDPAHPEKPLACVRDRL